ncbi:hypothetical protein PFBG_02338 [Plasmodium falciparum 7G8]|uniref:Stevor n=1 Tax=Plasmodium falciparum (isolate 7G8) TaxID=57266 RepID=W7FDZ5_PLAF8|nr:hypothetical protein PFBG_02338 [Plasmodium falciparum 7G8]
MISNNFKLIIFSIILGILTLIYNNVCERLYKNMKYKNIVLVSTNFRSLAELLYEPTKNHIHEINELKEYGNTNETKFKKNKYPNDDAKRKQNVPQVTEKEYAGTPKSMKYKNETCDKGKGAQSISSSRSPICLEMQRKLYNNFYVKPEMDFQNFLNKSNDKFCEYTNKKKMYNQLYIRNKVHNIYLNNLKKVCGGGSGVCTLSSVATGIIAPVPGSTASASGKALFVSTTVPYYCGIAALVLIIIAVALIILYIWLYRRRKNSCKHEWNKRLRR